MAFSKSRIFLLACVAINLGLATSQSLNVIWSLIIAIVLIVAGTLGWQNINLRVLIMCGLLFFGSAYWAYSSRPNNLSEYFQQEHEFYVAVTDDPNIKDKTIKTHGKILSIDGQAAKGSILLTMQRYPTFNYGTKFVLKGELEAKSEFSKKENVSGELAFAKVIRMEEGKGNRIKKLLYDIKHTLLKEIGEMLPQPESGLLAGIILGVQAMPVSYNDQFRITGTTHIIAVSGFNVTVIASALDKILRRFGRAFSFYTSLMAVAAFVVMTGASASVVRAGLMGGLALLAQHSGRMSFGFNTMLFASAIMLIQNPLLLQFDIGFQLSFGAMAGLMFVQPRLEKFSDNAFLKEYIFPTSAAQLATMPIILYHFGNVSTIAVLANLFALPIIPLCMFVGFATASAFMILDFLPKLLAFVPWIMLTYVIKVVGIFAKVPGAGFSELKFPLWAVVIYYAVLVTIILWKPKPKISSNS